MPECKPPNPGSKEAIAMGCRCPALDNAHGAGFPWGGKQSFYISELCKLHAQMYAEAEHDGEA